MTALTALLAAVLPLVAGPPRLVRVDARAALGPGGLTGTATLAVAGVGTLPLEPLGVAVTAARRADGSPLPLAPTPAGVAVSVAGDSQLSLDWSARGDDRLTLALPAAAVRTLELDLPADRTPVATAAVSGPFPGAAPDRRRWTLRFGGREPLALELRRPPDPAAGPLVRADRTVRWTLAPGVWRWAAEFTVDAVRGPLADLTFVVPAGLTVADATVIGGRVTLPFAGRVTLSGFAAPAAGDWTPPAVELVGGLPGAVVVAVAVAPELALARCDPGGTRLTAADGGRALTFTGPGTPTLAVTAAGPEVRTTEEQAWRVGRDESVLAVKLAVAVARGPLDRLTLNVPAGFAPRRVRAVPDDPDLVVAAAGDRLTLTPARPVPAGGKLTLEAEFVAAPPLPAGDPAAPPPPPARVTPPVIGVDGAADRQGTTAIAVGPGLTAWPAPGPHPYRGPPAPAALTLVADRPRVAVVSDIGVSAVPGGLAVRATGRAEPADGPVGGLTVFVPAGWTLRADGAAVGPVPGGEPAGWGAVAGGGLAARFAGRLVRVRPPRPTADPIALSAVGFVPAVPQVVPLPVVLGADTRPAAVRPGGAVASLEFDPPAGELPPTLTVRPRGAAPPPAPGGWAFADPGLTVRVGPAGRELTFAVTVTRAAGAVLPVALPAGAELLAAAVDGKRAEQVTGGVPLPDGPAAPRVELRYRLPAAGWRGVAVAPGLPADPGPVTVRWAFDPAVRRWPTLDAPAAPTPGGSVEWVVPAAGVRLAGFLVAAVMLGIAADGGRGAVLVVAGLLAAAGWVVPDGWGPVVRPAAAVGLLAAALPRRRPAAVPVQRRLPSTASYGAGVACLLLMAAGPLSVRLDAAEYELTAGDGGTAAGTARFALTAADAGPFTLPLSGVRLEAVELDGQPVVAAAAVGGYTFDLPAGPHALLVRFTVPVATPDGGRTVRVGTPDVPRCRVTVGGPAGAEVVSRRGVQRAEGGRVVADHGGGSVVEVRWPPTPAAPQAVREVCVWDVAPGSSRGVFAVRLQPGAGPFAVAGVELPAEVEAAAPTLRPDDGPAPAVSWRVDAGRVRVTFTPPADRPGWLVLPVVAAGPTLRLPTAGAGEAFAAVRGGPFAEVGRAGLIDFPADGLRPFADVPELRLAAAPAVRAFQRRPGQPAALTPVPAAPPADPPTAETVWTVGPTATVVGTVRAERATAGVIGFDLPPAVAVRDVRSDGSAVWWTRAGGRVTAWLAGPSLAPVTLTWAGELAAGGGDRDLELPGPGTVRAVPADGWAVLPLPDPGGVRVRAFAPLPPVSPTLKETAERAGDGLAYRGVVNLPLAAGRPHRFRVSLGDVPAGAVPELRGAKVGPAERAGDVVTWPVEADGPVTLTLAVRLPLPALLPEAGVRFDGPPLGWTAHGLAVGAGLTADDDRRVTAADPPPLPPPPTVVPVAAPAVGRNWPAAAGWLVAFGLLTAVRPATPERLTGYGVLGAAAVGGTLGYGFLAVAGVGLALRVGRLVLK